MKDNKIKDYDVLVIPSVRPSIIKDGKIDDPEEVRWHRPLPPEYRGGIDKKGVESVKKFVEGGGTLICFGSSCGFAIETFELPVRNVLDKVSDDNFYCPGAILKVSFKTDQPITYNKLGRASLLREQPRLRDLGALRKSTARCSRASPRRIRSRAAFSSAENVSTGTPRSSNTRSARTGRAVRVQPAVPLPIGGDIEFLLNAILEARR